MTKTFLNLALGLLISHSVFANESATLSTQSKRLESAISRKELFINFDKDMILTDSGKSEFAIKRVEHPFEITAQDGRTQRQIVIKCDLTQETKEKSVRLATSEKEGPWLVTKIEKIGSSVQKWTLSRKKQLLKMTCVALEKFEEKLEVTSMRSYYIDRVLAEYKSPVSEKIQIAGDAKSE